MKNVRFFCQKLIHFLCKNFYRCGQKATPFLLDVIEKNGKKIKDFFRFTFSFLSIAGNIKCTSLPFLPFEYVTFAAFYCQVPVE